MMLFNYEENRMHHVILISVSCAVLCDRKISAGILAQTKSRLSHRYACVAHFNGIYIA